MIMVPAYLKMPPDSIHTAIAQMILGEALHPVGWIVAQGKEHPVVTKNDARETVLGLQAMGAIDDIEKEVLFWQINISNLSTTLDVEDVKDAHEQLAELERKQAAPGN